MSSSYLTLLANRYGSDKGSMHGDRHRYAELYDVLWSAERGRVSRMAELGLARGGPETLAGAVERRGDSPSARIWHDYFPQAEIFGFDISDFSHLEAELPRFRFLRGDCGSQEDLAAFARMIGNEVDIIVDDASHASYHQQFALRELFPCLRPGGLYVIEDLHWQPGHIEARVPRVPRTFEWIDALRRGYGIPSVLWPESRLQWLSGQLAGVTLLRDLQVPGGRYVNALALLRKAGAS